MEIGWGRWGSYKNRLGKGPKWTLGEGFRDAGWEGQRKGNSEQCY